MVDAIKCGGVSGQPYWDISLPSIGYAGPSSNHPGEGGPPTGGNFLSEDGRVDWIRFNGNTNAIGPAAQSTVGLYFCKPLKIGNGPW